jgi:hypothetical protein
MAYRGLEKFEQAYNMGSKIWNADAERRMRKDLADAGRLTPEQQTLGVNAPAQGQVPVGYENYIQAGEGGSFVPREEAGLDQAGLEQRRSIASSFNQPGAFTGERTTYNVGGLTQDKAFSPAELMSARRQAMGDVYTKYGMPEKADEMTLRGMQAEAAGLQIRKSKGELERDEKWRARQSDIGKVYREAASTASMMKELIDQGDYEAAARVGVKFRSKDVGDSKQIRINESGILEGSMDGGKTWSQAAGTKGNVYNPEVVKNMLGQIKNSADEYVSSSLQEFATDPGQLASIMNAAKDQAFRQTQLEQQDRQFGITTGLDREKIVMSQKALDETIRNNKSTEVLKRLEIGQNAELKKAYYDALKTKTSSLLGVSADGQGIYMTQDGIEARPLPKGVSGKEDFFRKTTGDKAIGEQEFAKWIKDNPDAPAASVNNMRRNLGLLPPIDYGISDNAEGLNPSLGVTPLPRRLDVTRPSQSVRMFTDPLTRESISEADYMRKYGERP